MKEAIKYDVDGIEVEYSLQPFVDENEATDPRRQRIIQGIASLDDELQIVNEKLAELNKDIDRLTNHADGLDYAFAVTSGVIAGIVDATIVGEWNFKNAKEISYKETNNKVIDFAKKQPDYISFCNNALESKGNPRIKPKDPNRLNTAIEFLEWKFHLPGDGEYRKGQFGISPNTHRLDDMCHHPTLVGLVSCVIVQFTGKTRYVNKLGEDIRLKIDIDESGEFVGKNFVTKIFAGVINWFIKCAKAISNRRGHLYSDMATKSSIPGSILSMITELASIPCFRNEKFLTELRNAFQNGFGTGKGQVDLGAFNALFEGAENKLDITTEKAVAHELKRQAIPVVINEVLVRGVYFIRHFIVEIKEKQSLKNIEWDKVIPFNNRTIVRMLTIATGTFMAIDMADAAIHSAIKTKTGTPTEFFSKMLLRVNFVGIGRFAIAIGTDSVMGMSRGIKRNKRIRIQKQQIMLLNARVAYKQADVWISAENVEETINEAYDMMEQTTIAYFDAMTEIRDSLRCIGGLTQKIENNNPGLLSDIGDVLKWGE